MQILIIVISESFDLQSTLPELFSAIIKEHYDIFPSLSSIHIWATWNPMR